MTVPSRRTRQQRSIYTRVPDGGSFRVNEPGGFLVAYPPVPTPGDANDIVGQQAAWWYGNDATVSRTTGSPLTVPNPRGERIPTGSVLPAITRCTQVIVDACVRTRWSYTDRDGRHLDRPLWIDDPMGLARLPGPIFALQPSGRRLDGQSFFATLLADAILWGRGAFSFIEGSDGSPIAGSLIPLNPFMVSVREDGRVVLDPYGESPLVTDHDGRWQMGGDQWRVVVLHGQYPNHEGWPQGVLLKHFNTFRVGVRINSYIDQALMGAGVPSGYLSVATPNFGTEYVTDENGEEIREDVALKRDWMRAHGMGVREVAVVNSAVTYTPVNATTPVDADAARLQSVSLQSIAHAFGLSSVWLDEGATGGLQYSNSSERRADLVSLTAAGWGEKLTGLLSSLMPYGTKAEVLWSTFVAPSIETLAPSLVSLVQTGILTGAEARQMLGVTPWTGPDPAYTDNTPAAHEPEPVPPQLLQPPTPEEEEEAPA